MAEKTGQEKQPGLWDDLAVNPGPGVKIAMNEAAKRSRRSRVELAEEMTRLARRAGIKLRVTEAMLAKWLNVGAENYAPPLSALLLFCQATDDEAPLSVFVAAFPGVKLVSQEDWELLEWAKSERVARQARRRARQMAPKVGME